MTSINISEITDQIEARSIKTQGVERLKEKISQIGYLPEKPIVLAPNGNGYILIDGAHRVEALKGLGIKKVEALIDETLVTEALQYRRARLANEVAEAIVPTTFVDDAELIWRLSEIMTQTEIGSVLGWSRDLVARYVALKKICTDAWTIIVTTINETVTELIDEGVTKNVMPVTENLLRAILFLTDSQQLELIQKLTSGKFDKKQFSKQAETYRLRNDIIAYIFEELPELSQEFLAIRITDIDRGGFDSDYLTGDKPKLNQLINALRDEWQQKSGTQIINGDFELEVLNIDAGIVDLILTDPPYNISNSGKVTKKGQAIVNAEFGDWDDIDQFRQKLSKWAEQWARIMKPGASLIVFCDRLLISDLWRILEETGLRGKQIIVWRKTNPNPASLGRSNLISATEFMIWAIKTGAGYTFNETDIWDRHNIIETSLCAGEERITDDKGDTLHPTQKPLTLLNPLIGVFSNRGDLIFDGFAGVGSIGKSAIDQGRKFIGIELRQDYFLAMQKRLS